MKLGVVMWISVLESLPESEKSVLVFYKNSHNKGRIVKAFYAERFSIESDPESDNNDEYMFEHDRYYLCEGWYEIIDNWDDLSAVYFYDENKPTHWMNLPSPPSDMCNKRPTEELLTKKLNIATMALNAISSGFADSKEELEDYAELKLIDIERVGRHGK